MTAEPQSHESRKRRSPGDYRNQRRSIARSQLRRDEYEGDSAPSSCASGYGTSMAAHETRPTSCVEIWIGNPHFSQVVGIRGGSLLSHLLRARRTETGRAAVTCSQRMLGDSGQK